MIFKLKIMTTKNAELTPIGWHKMYTEIVSSAFYVCIHLYKLDKYLHPCHRWLIAVSNSDNFYED